MLVIVLCDSSSTKSNGTCWPLRWILCSQIDAKDPGYASKERARLEKLVQSRITEDKKKAMRMKLGILPSFE